MVFMLLQLTKQFNKNESNQFTKISKTADCNQVIELYKLSSVLK